MLTARHDCPMSERLGVFGSCQRVESTDVCNFRRDLARHTTANRDHAPSRVIPTMSTSTMTFMACSTSAAATLRVKSRRLVSREAVPDAILSFATAGVHPRFSRVRSQANPALHSHHRPFIRPTRATRNAGARANRLVVRAEGKEDDAKCTGSCDSCGLAKDKMQCDGSGRIIGGMGAIPLFSWWPIKAYRPCPGLIESGGVYVRKGQDVDSILWGEKGK